MGLLVTRTSGSANLRISTSQHSSQGRPRDERRLCGVGVLGEPARGGRRTGGGRITLLLSVLLLVWWAAPTGLTAQTEADRASVTKVVESLFLGVGTDEVARHPGIWSVVIARFSKGDMREIDIPAKVGDWYQVIGGSESDETDVDVCVYGPEGGQISCDTLEDNFPVVSFTARTEGIFRAVMTAASVDGGTSYAGMVVLRIGGDEWRRWGRREVIRRKGLVVRLRGGFRCHGCMDQLLVLWVSLVGQVGVGPRVRDRLRWIRMRFSCSALLVPASFGGRHSPLAAQDCAIGRDDWDDIQRFRRCLEEYDPDRWGDPWLLHKASRSTANPTIVRLLLQEGWNPNAPDDGGLSPLHQGAQNSNPMVMSHLLDAGADLNARDNDGYTALHWAAAQSGNGRVIKVLLDRGADPLAESNDGRTPLHSALSYRADRSVLSAMLEAGAKEHLTPLQLSVLRGDSMALSSLLADGADPNETDRYGWSSLHFAVPLAGPEVVSALLAAGADLDARTVSGATALHLAAPQAAESVVFALLGAGADPNVRHDGGGGWAPLHYAGRFQGEALLPVITSLLQAGADPGSSQERRDDNGLSPLHQALMNPEVTAPVIEVLLEAGADPVARDQDGDTPLHIAANWTDDLAIIEALLDAGADVTAKNEDGDRPMDLAWDIRGSEAYWRLVAPEGVLVAGRTLSGSLSSSDPAWGDGAHYDVWKVSARAAGQRLTVSMDSDDVDSYLRVLRTDGTSIATDDDGGSGSNARVEFRATDVGDYLVIVTSYEAGRLGRIGWG